MLFEEVAVLRVAGPVHTLSLVCIIPNFSYLRTTEIHSTLCYTSNGSNCNDNIFVLTVTEERTDSVSRWCLFLALLFLIVVPLLEVKCKCTVL